MPAATLARREGVELIRTGRWGISTGVWTATREDLVAAVAALSCPAVRKPIIKIGHTDRRFQPGDGEPALGWYDNLRLTDGGHTLIADQVAPGWLADVQAAAWPNRSVEGSYNYRCGLGHTHPFVLTAVALLGVTPPGVSTLTGINDLADVKALYGIAAAGGVPGDLVTAHLPGRHDQKRHGRRKSRGGPDPSDLRRQADDARAEYDRLRAQPVPFHDQDALRALMDKTKAAQRKWAELEYKAYTAADADARERESTPLKPAVEKKQKTIESRFDELIGEAATGDAVHRSVRVKLDELLDDPRQQVGDVTGARVGAALERYKSNDYEYINRGLRDTKGDEDRLDGKTFPDGTDVDRAVGAIDAAMGASPLGRDSVTWRGMLYPEGVFGAAWNSRDVTGLEWTDHAFTSTSVHESGARTFAHTWSSHLEGAGSRVVMRVLTPAGVGAVNISGTTGEAELLLERGLSFRVVRDHGVRDNARYLDVEVLRR